MPVGRVDEVGMVVGTGVHVGSGVTVGMGRGVADGIGRGVAVGIGRGVDVCGTGVVVGATVAEGALVVDVAVSGNTPPGAVPHAANTTEVASEASME